MQDLAVNIRNFYSLESERIYVNNLVEASQKVFKEAFRLGGRAWGGYDDKINTKVGIVFYKNKPICRISDNGRVWDLNEEYKEIDPNNCDYLFENIQ